jgi:hypothetical protein
MVLAEETPEGVTFRFKGNRWAVATIIPGVVLLGLVSKLHFSSHSPNWLLFIVGIFGLLLVYSSIYSATADQWLAVSGNRKTIKFYKKNLYGLVEWERSSQDFQCIKVGRYIRSSNWQIALVCSDGFELYIGENVFGAFTLERAMNLAMKVSNRTGINVESGNQAYSRA